MRMMKAWPRNRQCVGPEQGLRQSLSSASVDKRVRSTRTREAYGGLSSYFVADAAVRPSATFWSPRHHHSHHWNGSLLRGTAHGVRDKQASMVHAGSIHATTYWKTCFQHTAKVVRLLHNSSGVPPVASMETQHDGRQHHDNDTGTTPPSLISKVADSAQAVLEEASSRFGVAWVGATVAVGGFGVGGVPETCMQALSEYSAARDLTLISIDGAVDKYGPALLFESAQQNKVRKLVAAYIGGNRRIQQKYLQGNLRVDLVPMGNLVERLRAGGSGIPAFYTPTGVGTLYETGGLPVQFAEGGQVLVTSSPRETRVWDGQTYLLETALRPMVSVVKAAVADTRGNLVFRGTSQNSNPDAAMAATHLCIAEAETIVPAGTIPPDEIHLPGIFVHRVVPATYNEKPIEKLKLRQRIPLQQHQFAVSSSSLTNSKISNSGLSITDAHDMRTRIARRAAQELQHGTYVNLGIGLPTMIPDWIPPHTHVEFQAENGLLGVGPYPATAHEASPDFVNAGKETVTASLGASAFRSSVSFGMIRGNHIDLTVLGGLQCSAKGDLASWIIPGKTVKGMGGAMDLVGAPGIRVVVTMTHTNKDGAPKILEECTLPLTGSGVVDMIVTERAVFKCNGKDLLLVEIGEGFCVKDIERTTACNFRIAENLKVFQ